MTAPGCPCKGCGDRSAECHAGCERYAEWSKEKRQENAEEYKRNLAEYAIVAQYNKRHQRWLTQWKKKGGRKK